MHANEKVFAAEPATSCTPTGNPSLVQCSGSEMAGWPVACQKEAPRRWPTRFISSQTKKASISR
jgi:hypothetical protein